MSQTTTTSQTELERSLANMETYIDLITDAYKKCRQLARESRERNEELIAVRAEKAQMEKEREVERIEMDSVKRKNHDLEEALASKDEDLVALREAETDLTAQLLSQKIEMDRVTGEKTRMGEALEIAESSLETLREEKAATEAALSALQGKMGRITSAFSQLVNSYDKVLMFSLNRGSGKANAP